MTWELTLAGGLLLIVLAVASACLLLRQWKRVASWYVPQPLRSDWEAHANSSNLPSGPLLVPRSVRYPFPDRKIQERLDS